VAPVVIAKFVVPALTGIPPQAVATTHEVFNGFDNDSVGQLKDSLSYQIIAKNSQIFEMGDQPNVIYYLLKGALTLKFPDNSTIQLQEGELIGEIGVLNGQKPA